MYSQVTGLRLLRDGMVIGFAELMLDDGAMEYQSGEDQSVVSIPAFLGPFHGACSSWRVSKRPLTL